MAKLSKKKVILSIEGSAGVLSIIAKRCNVTRSAITQFLQNEKHSDVLSLINTEKEKICDIAETKLIELINEKNFNAIRYYLSIYGGKHDIAIQQNTQINVNNLQLIQNLLQTNEAIWTEEESDKTHLEMNTEPRVEEFTAKHNYTSEYKSNKQLISEYKEKNIDRAIESIDQVDLSENLNENQEIQLI